MPNSCTVRPVNDLKSIGFLDNLSYDAKREQSKEEMMVIKLFASNYARDLMAIKEKEKITMKDVDR